MNPIRRIPPRPRHAAPLGLICASVLTLAACAPASSPAPAASTAAPPAPTAAPAATKAAPAPTTAAAAPTTAAPAKPTSAPAAAGDLGLITPGEVTVAISTGNMPYNGLKDGKLTGLDGELFAKAAADLGLKVNVVEIDFTGLLAGVQSRRFDIGIGDVAWRKARAEKGLFTDPPFYSPAVAAEKPGLHANTIGSLQGLNLGTQDSFFFIDGLKKIPNANLRTYPSQQTLFAELDAGRIDVAFLDPLGMVQAHQLAPNLKFDEVTFTPPTPEELAATPEYGVFLPFMDGWYLNSQEQKFEEALNNEIRNFYASGFEAQEIKAWGGNPDVMLKPDPSFASDRRGVDRPNDWAPPSI